MGRYRQVGECTILYSGLVRKIAQNFLPLNCLSAYQEESPTLKAGTERAKEKIGEPPFPIQFPITIKNHLSQTAVFSCIYVGKERQNSTEQLIC